MYGIRHNAQLEANLMFDSLAMQVRLRSAGLALAFVVTGGRVKMEQCVRACPPTMAPSTRKAQAGQPPQVPTACPGSAAEWPKRTKAAELADHLPSSLPSSLWLCLAGQPCPSVCLRRKGKETVGQRGTASGRLCCLPHWCSCAQCWKTRAKRLHHLPDLMGCRGGRGQLSGFQAFEHSSATAHSGLPPCVSAPPALSKSRD